MDKIRGSEFPTGPCGLPVTCTCGTVVTAENVVEERCDNDGWCDICSYCGTTKCPTCKAHTHCGGCV